MHKCPSWKFTRIINFHIIYIIIMCFKLFPLVIIWRPFPFGGKGSRMSNLLFRFMGIIPITTISTFFRWVFLTTTSKWKRSILCRKNRCIIDRVSNSSPYTTDYRSTSLSSLRNRFITNFLFFLPLRNLLSWSSIKTNQCMNIIKQNTLFNLDTKVTRKGE